MAKPYNINVSPLTGTWTQVLTDEDKERRGTLRSQLGVPIHAEVAHSDSPPADEVLQITQEPEEYVLPAYKELWARREGGGGGTTELHGQLEFSTHRE